MRRTVLFALMISTLLLCACNSAKGYEDEVADYRAALVTANVSLTAEIRADYGEKILEYTLSYTEAADGSNTLEVLSPALIAGVKAHFAPGSSTLEFDGLILEPGDLTDEGLTPISALPAIVSSLKSGFLQKMWIEELEGEEALVLELAVSDSSTQTVWMNAETMTPLYTEIKNENQTVIFCVITQWDMT